MLISLLALLAQAPSAPTELYDYLNRPDKSFEWRRAEDIGGLTRLSVTSQTWQGNPWKHDLVIGQPSQPIARGTMLLVLTGGVPNESDTGLVRAFVASSKLPVAVLFGIPNQPLYGVEEDELIAYTLVKYFETGDASWPLLFPMTKSALRAMDAIQAYTSRSSNPIRRFVIAGASKRGWTTWLVGAAKDRRVAGIAPMVIDNLNVGAQMKHQVESWGGYSPQIDAYTKLGLQQKVASPEGMRLAAMIDPYSYRDTVTTPTMIINGANDAYWTVDALSLYWDELKQPKWALVVPNAGHSLGDRQWAMSTLGAFARSCAGVFKMPRPTWRWDGDTLVMSDPDSKKGQLKSVSVWTAASNDLKFQDKKWTMSDTRAFDRGIKSVTFAVQPRKSNAAVFGQFEYEVDGNRFNLTTPVRVFPGR